MFKRIVAGSITIAAIITLCWLSPSSAQTPGAAQANMLTDAEKAEGWRLLFDGRTLLGWVLRGGTARWGTEEGSIVAEATAESSQIATAEEYTNFRLKVDFWPDQGLNSGVFLRGPRDPRAPVHQFSFYEVNIADDHKTFPTGSVVDLLRFDPAPKSVGQWNTYDILAEGNHLVVVLNGITTVDVKNGLHYSGVIALQAWNTGKVRFRNIKIKPLP